MVYVSTAYFKTNYDFNDNDTNAKISRWSYTSVWFKVIDVGYVP